MASYSGRFVPTNKNKYKGDWSKITYRSSWEHWLMKRLDNDPTVLRWNSEETVIPYYSTVDQKKRRYYMDFWAIYQLTDGSTQEFFFEVKPKKETQEPPRPAKLTAKAKQRYMNELYTYKVNCDKWEAAQTLADKRGIKFRLITEDALRRMGMPI